MNSDYIRSIWKELDETKAHDCIAEIFSAKGFMVKNYHRDDRIHEDGIDLLCTNEQEKSEICFAVKKKPKKGDIKQLETIATKQKGRTKQYIYLDSPTKPFDDAMKKYKDIAYVDWMGFNDLLLSGGSIQYILLYFSAHPVFRNVRNIYKLLYEKRNVNYFSHDMTRKEREFIWELKDDSVKFKSIAEYLYGHWRPLLIQKTDYVPKEYSLYVEHLQKEFDLLNSIGAEPLLKSAVRMAELYPYFIGQYWSIVSYRTTWKDFTAKAESLGETSQDSLDDYILNEWIIPSKATHRYGSRYYPMSSVYSALMALVENTYEIGKDIEAGIDWLYRDLIS